MSTCNGQIVQEHEKQDAAGEAGGKEESSYLKMTECVTDEMHKLTMLQKARQAQSSSHEEGSENMESR